MFAGLPGIGVGTLFYVILALLMPFRELWHVMHGTSSLRRWRLIATQLVYSVCIIASIAVADRVLLYLLGKATPGSLSPARLLNEGFSAGAPQSILAAPIMASCVLLGGVVLTIEVLRAYDRFSKRPRRQPALHGGFHRERVEFAEPSAGE